jgi:glutaredoxin-related protein
MAVNKPILFYSNYCQHSREIINLFQKNNVIDSFMLINISAQKYKIPSFIKSVPTLYFNKKTYSDNELESFINDNIINKNNSIEAFFPSEMSSGIGYNYSYLESQNDNIRNSLMFISDEDEKNKINTPNENDFLSSSDNSVNMNKLTEQREQDLQKILHSDKNSEQRTFIR